jgi:hypothetical protein
MRHTNWIATALLALVPPITEAQIAQDRPELCSSLDPVPLPLGLSAISTGTGTDLTFRLRDGSSKSLQLTVPDEIDQICPLDRERLAAFGGVRGGDGYIVWILSEQAGTILDTIGARDPRLSPDRRWLIYRQRYPTQSEAVFEQYLLYDLSKDAAGNQPSGARHEYPPGRLVYPVTASRARLEDLTLTPDQYHTFPGKSFFWSADSKSVASADHVGKTTSIIVVRIEATNLLRTSMT